MMTTATHDAATRSRGRTPIRILALAAVAALSACATHEDHAHGDRDGATPHAEAFARTNADPAADAALMPALTALQGEWQMQDEAGQWITGTVFTVSSNDSVIREVMFPGTPNEMTNLYHMDGTDAVVTHYCAVGNQPRMVAAGITETPEGPAIDYTFDSVSNLRPEHTHVMGGLRLVFLSDTHIRQDWTSYDPSTGEVAGEMSFNLMRRN
jgi:hypothetical protein